MVSGSASPRFRRQHQRRTNYGTSDSWPGTTVLPSGMPERFCCRGEPPGQDAFETGRMIAVSDLSLPLGGKDTSEDRSPWVAWSVLVCGAVAESQP